MSNVADLTGMTFGKLTVIEYAGTNKGRHKLWKCKCSCEDGKEVIVIGSNLKTGNTTSCGCSNMIGHKTHGDRVNGKTARLYRIWRSMVQRCHNPNDRAYKWYGARGVKVTVEWRVYYEKFRDWAYQNGYEEGLEIDRIDNFHSIGYHPDNCHFTTRKGNNRNKSDNLKVMYQGKELCLSECAELSGINYQTLFSRYSKGERGAKLFRPIRAHKEYKERQPTKPKINAVQSTSQALQPSKTSNNLQKPFQNTLFSISN